MEIQDVILQQVIKAAGKKIDVDKLAERLAPKLAAEIEKQVIYSICESETLYDVVSETLRSAALKKALAARVTAAFAV